MLLRTTLVLRTIEEIFIQMTKGLSTQLVQRLDLDAQISDLAITLLFSG